MRKIEKPVTRSRGHDDRETVTTHPAFANISVSRISSITNLYASDFTHSQFIRLRVGKSEMIRSLNEDRHFSSNCSDYIEVDMTESQWATFVSSFGAGRGTPCTLTSFNGERIPELPPPGNHTDIFEAEIKEKLAGIIGSIRETVKQIESMKLPQKKTAQIIGALSTLQMELTSNLPFVAEQFEEHMEKVVENAKAEVHGFMMSHMTSIAGRSLPLRIEGKKDES